VFEAVAYVAVALLIAHTLLSKEGRHAWSVLSGMRPRHVAVAAASVTSCACVLWALWQVPWLRHGWWSLAGGDGTLVAGTSSQLPGWVTFWAAGLVVVAIPAMAYTEELTFRDGIEKASWWGRTGAAVGFGLVHLIVGVPPAFALALVVLGAVTTVVYLREWRRQVGSATASASARTAAIAEASRVHMSHNYLIVVVVAVSFAAGW
jgi:hypothetical protein